MRNKKTWVILGMLVFVFLTGCGSSKNTFATVTDSELFQTIPVMTGEKLEFSEVTDVGGGNFMITADNTTKQEYDDYLAVLEQDGFKKHVDNSDSEGLEGYVYTSHYLKEELLVVVSYLSKMEDTVITVGKDAVLSEHLFYSEDYVADNIEGAKTTITMPELYTAGNSFILQLKNGHFIINDGGEQDDLPYLLDFLDSKVEKGEKPIVEAWFISHAHKDHMGTFLAFYEKQEYTNRLYVEEVYFTVPSVEAQQGDAANYDQAETLCFYTETVPGILRSTSGSAPTQIRMRLGERYFFNDFTIDVMFTPDILPYQEWKTWNATSVGLMYTIEGQKMLITGDIDWECQKVMLETFDDDYFNMAIYQAPHHGGNVYNQFSSHLKVDTILYPSFDVERGKTALLGRRVQNQYLKSISKEALGWGDGGVTLTFPYEVGTYEKLPLTEWIYHEEGPKNR